MLFQCNNPTGAQAPVFTGELDTTSMRPADDLHFWFHLSS
jgi:hypothetical protein